MDGGPFPADHMQHISPVSAVEVELRRHLVQFAPHMVPMLDELLQEERSRMRQQEYEMMYMQEEYQNLKDVFQQQQQVSAPVAPPTATSRRFTLAAGFTCTQSSQGPR
jgi:hypothetical protein